MQVGKIYEYGVELNSLWKKAYSVDILGAHFQTKYYLLDVRVKRDRFIGLCPVFCMAISGKTVFFEGKMNIALYRQDGQAIMAMRKVSKV